MDTHTERAPLTEDEVNAILATSVNVEDDVTDCQRVCCNRQAAMSVTFHDAQPRLCPTHHLELVYAITDGWGKQWLDAYLPVRVRTLLPRV